MKGACVIGWPISHSRSPLIHGYWLERYGIAGSYTRVPVKPEEAWSFLRNLKAQGGYVGCNVTIPHKETAFAAADVLCRRRRQRGRQTLCGTTATGCWPTTRTGAAS